MATTAAIASKEVTLSHGKTRYLESGTGHPVILLHGASVAGGADDYRPLLERLNGRYRALAPDFIGWPPSDARANVDAIPYLTDEVRDLHDALRANSRHIGGCTM